MRRSSYAEKYTHQFQEGRIEMMELYRRYLIDLHQSRKDESRQLLCLPHSIRRKTYRKRFFSV